MSDFERRILDAVNSLEHEESIKADALEADQLAKAAREAEQSKLRQQASLLGMEAVSLLQKYNVPSIKIWKRVPTGNKETYFGHSRSGNSGYRERNELDYKYSGKGWGLYHVRWYDPSGDLASEIEHIGISDSGEIFERAESREATKRYPLPPTRISGFLNPSYTDPAAAVSLIEGELFHKGVASRVSGRGEYRTEKKMYER